MILGHELEHLEITVIEVQPAVPGVTAGGDVHVKARVRSGAFTGAADAWIMRDDWRTFCEQLAELDRTRQGSAFVASMSPGELRLNVRAIDRAGHLGIDGELTHFYYRAGAAQALRLEFGLIEFDPTMLPSLVAELRDAR